jgi:hypothetical protein
VWRDRPSGTKARIGWTIEVLIVAILGLLAWQAATSWQEVTGYGASFPTAVDSIIQLCIPHGCSTNTPRLLTQLNRTQPGRAEIGSSVLYVGPDVSSTGPNVVSINSVTYGTFAAVALGDNGTCYAELIFYGDVVGSGGQFWAAFQRGVPCKGRMATRFTVTDSEEPY